ncbi:hypothetical protein EVG20_g7939 [Dentipellis fragilis]|uniref:Uncharacterized protein n=1 Tax=Dentipellis fragilis TaxID=205917 RepID=A0A4Y9Y9N6_9AGAM|nr:hypothetical protein EVG20_g7939 [Dentipellis fragilis]
MNAFRAGGPPLVLLLSPHDWPLYGLTLAYRSCFLAQYIHPQCYPYHDTRLIYRHATFNLDAYLALSTSQRTTAPRRQRPWFSTLDPTRLSPDDFCDLSGTLNARPLRKVKIHGSSVLSLYYGMEHRECLPFPPDTRGFFYYYPTSTPRVSDDPDGRPENRPRVLVGEVRFRLTRTSDPSCFAEGQDLRHADGLPWSVPFERIATHPGACDLRTILLRDGLVSEEQLEHEREHVRRSGVSSRRVVSRRVMSGLGQPFSANLSRKNWSIVVDSVAGPAGPERKWVPLQNLFLQPDGRPYFSGKMICCLERSPLPEHADLRVLVIRVLKITDPLAPLAPLPPERAMDVPVEGALVSRKGSPHLIRVYRSGALLPLLLGAKAASASDSAPPEQSFNI